MISIELFLCKFGINKTSNFDLLDISNDLEIPVKVLMKDELKIKHIESEIPLIINYQNVNQKGIHWVGYFKKYYFDSYGLPPLKELENFVNEYNKNDFQSNMNVEYCGQLSLYVLYKLYNNIKFSDIINEINLFLQSFI